MTADQVVADTRRRLFAIAYRMLGEVGEAEDAVQEAFVRWERCDGPATPTARSPPCSTALPQLCARSLPAPVAT